MGSATGLISNNVTVRRSNLLTRFSLALLYLLILLYNCHRYILQVNSAGTSPTYASTPLFWKILKYILAVVILMLFYTSRKFQTRWPGFMQVLMIICSLMLVMNILDILIYGDFFFDELEYIFFAFLTMPFFLLDHNVVKYIKNQLPRIIGIATWFVIITQAYVVANFLATGRLPALGFENAMVRFGGLWDDPNGFGFFCVYLLFENFNRRKYFLSMCLVGCIAATGSLTAIVLVIVSVFYWINFAKLKLRQDFATIGVLGLIGVVITGIIFSEKILSYLKQKQESIAIHTSNNLEFSLLPLSNGPLQFHETWLLSFTYNYFPLSIFVDLMILWFVAQTTLSNRKSGIEFYIYIFLVASMFLPLLYVFPLNIIFFIFLAIHVVELNSTSKHGELSSLQN